MGSDGQKPNNRKASQIAVRPSADLPPDRRSGTRAAAPAVAFAACPYRPAVFGGEEDPGLREAPGGRAGQARWGGWLSARHVRVVILASRALAARCWAEITTRREGGTP